MEVVKYASLWATRDANRIHDSKMLLVFMEMNIRMGINCKPQLSPTVYNSLQGFAEFKADFHNIYLKTRKHPTNKWSVLLFIAIDDMIFNVLETW